MTKTCLICGQPILNGQRVLVGVLTTFVEIPSQKSWAIEKPDDYVFINHADCEEV